MKRSKKIQEEILQTLLNSNYQELSETERDKNITYFLDEIKSMRDEINWRVKMAYTGSLIFLSAITFTISMFFQEEGYALTQMRDNPDSFTIVTMIAVLAVSAWAGVQNANHLIEKRIELYSLELIKAVKLLSDHPHASWLGFLYGNSFFKNKVKTSIAKYLNASIGFFIYFLPNLVAISLLWFLYQNGKIEDYVFWVALVTFFVFVAAASTFMFFLYVHKVNSKCTEFYNNEMQSYFQRTNEALIRSREGTKGKGA